MGLIFSREARWYIFQPLTSTHPRNQLTGTDIGRMIFTGLPNSGGLSGVVCVGVCGRGLQTLSLAYFKNLGKGTGYRLKKGLPVHRPSIFSLEIVQRGY